MSTILDIIFSWPFSQVHLPKQNLLITGLWGLFLFMYLSFIFLRHKFTINLLEKLTSRNAYLLERSDFSKAGRTSLLHKDNCTGLDQFSIESNNSIWEEAKAGWPKKSCRTGGSVQVCSSLNIM